MIRQYIVVFLHFVLFTGVATAADKPNFVWLISEDNSIHYLSLFDEHGAETPRIAQLAQHGLLFEHAFSNAPVCSVARTTLMTSCYAPRIGTQYHRKYVTVPMPENLRMFSAYLREAGYYATNNKKKDYNANEGAGVWDASSGTATWRNRNAGQPFFHMQSFGASHEGTLHFSASVMNQQKTITDPETVFVPPYHPDTPTFRYTHAQYHDRIRTVDSQIGQVIDELEEDGLLEDTFVFYFGDHGGVLPRGKGYAYESGLHVPLVVRVPDNWKQLVDAKLGSRIGGFVSFVDFGPTLLNLAGVEVPEKIDGKPFLGPGVSGPAIAERDEAFGYADRFDEKYDLVRTLRKGKYEYVRSYQPFNFDGLQNNYRYRMLAFREWRKLYQAGELNEAQRQFFEARPAEMLFDIDADPHEVHNLAGDPRHAEVLADMRGRMTEKVKSMPDLSFYPESYLADEAFDDPVAFGQANKQEIADLVDIANLNLVPFSEAKERLRNVLSSDNPWHRYWGLIVCSSHGMSTRRFINQAKELAAGDSELLVRTRAAEYLGLIGADDPRPTIMDALAESSSGIEAGLMLNSLVLLQDGKPGYRFEISTSHFQPDVRQNDTVKRRMEYLEK